MNHDVPAECLVFHKDLGHWDAETVVLPGPGAEPQRSKGIMIARLTGAGRWLVTDYIADSGFEGHGVYGWDPARQKYVATWVDNMRPFLLVSEGTWDEARRTMTFLTEIPKPDGTTFRLRETTETVDDRTQIFRSFFPLPGGEFEMMRVTYTKRP